MGYSSYKKLNQVTKKFGLDARLINLFSDIKTIEPSDWLKTSLKMAKKMPLTNEKTKSERLVSPILMEVAVFHEKFISMFSGEEITINSNDDLAGPCDFFFALHPPKPYIDTPIISLVEAKDEDLEWGIAQCAAQVYGAHLFNIQEGKDLPILYGCATDGVEWQFFKFENNIFYVDTETYTSLPEIIGVWHYILNFFIDNYADKV